MNVKIILLIIFFVGVVRLPAQDSAVKKFKGLSCPEKWWVVWHPFTAKKALNISELARETTKFVQQEKMLKGNGDGDQLDAFRHTFWMASLTKEIGWKRALKLGKAHEKGNYRDYKKHRKEDGKVPDKVGSEMDLYNNDVGIAIGRREGVFELKLEVIETVIEGRCKMVKRDSKGNYLNCAGEIIPRESLKGKWENNKCLVPSNVVN